MTIKRWGVAMLVASCTMVMGCKTFSPYPYDCNDYAACEEPPPPCPGQCVPLPPLDFNGPALLWMGNERDAPPCPDRALSKVFEGFADLDASHECPACACSPPACVLPSGLTADGQTCPGGGVQTPFNAPLEWNGACVSPGTVPPAVLGSVNIEPVTVAPCKPVAGEVPMNWAFDPSWGTYALGCAGEATSGVCGHSGMTCLPTADPPPPGFRQCIHYLRDGDPTCPEEYPDKFMFWGGLDDTRACTPCECAEAAPSTCSALVSYYQDDMCTMIVGSASIGTAGMPQCHPVMSGLPLGGLAATWMTNVPGTCDASGGVPVGTAEPLNPTTFCCQPPP